MTSPRPDFLETLRQMAQKPDATRTPDPKASFDDLMRQLTGGGTVSNRYEGLRPAIPVLQGMMPDYISGPAGAEGAAAKLAAEVPAGQSGMLGALERLVAPQQGPLAYAGKGVPMSEDVALFRGQLKGYRTGPGYTKGGSTIGEWWTPDEREAAEYAARASEDWKRLRGTGVEKSSKNWAPSGDAVILKAVVPKDVAEMYRGPTDRSYVIPPTVAGQFLRRPK